jgi:hemolysin III
VTNASVLGDPWAIVGVAIYSFTVMLLFAASALHHLINASESVERALRLFDYCAIFPLIAGTATPAIFICLRHELGMVYLRDDVAYCRRWRFALSDAGH